MQGGLIVFGIIMLAASVLAALVYAKAGNPVFPALVLLFGLIIAVTSCNIIVN